MTAAWMLTLVLAGSPLPKPVGEDAVPSETAASPRRSQAPVEVRGRDALRDAYRRAMQKSASRVNPEPEEVVPELAALYVELAGVPGMAHSEKRRLRHGVKSRLEQMRGRLIRDGVRRTREAGREKHPSSGRHTGRNEGKLSGGGANARAVELIELIQNTIAPDTWTVNGGNGSIRYYSPLHVLVVRQTGEVHHQLGGTLEALRR